jgi:excisionase family DNA binding protein
METFLDAGQVAEVLGLSLATIRKWVLVQYIPYQKLGRAVRFSVPEIREWVKNRTVKPVEEQGTPGEVTGNEGGKHMTRTTTSDGGTFHIDTVVREIGLTQRGIIIVTNERRVFNWVYDYIKPYEGIRYTLNLTHKIEQFTIVKERIKFCSPVQTVLTPGGPSLGARFRPPGQPT